MNVIQQQYEGFTNTPFLWNGNLFSLQQFEFSPVKTKSFQTKLVQKLRLGKLVERFVSFELQQNSSIQILTENIQIQDNKVTLGELDCILLQNEEPIHLEIVYKFYLYDSSVGTTEIEHWIGPNRRDALVQKITKLKEKQLPLLYHKKTESYLHKINLVSTDIKQQVYFKAQLFVHLKEYQKQFPLINNNCIYGFYIYRNELEEFKKYKFYIPTKHNWLVDIPTNIDWFNFDNFKKTLNTFLSERNSPLCWLKKTNGEVYKFFVVWWE